MPQMVMKPPSVLMVTHVLRFVTALHLIAFDCLTWFCSLS